MAGVWTFATDAASMRHGWRPGDKTITVCYLDAAPLAVAPRLSDMVRAAADDNGPVRACSPVPWRRSHRGAGTGSTRTRDRQHGPIAAVRA